MDKVGCTGQGSPSLALRLLTIDFIGNLNRMFSITLEGMTLVVDKLKLEDFFVKKVAISVDNTIYISKH
jgi:hypothetical protein